MEYVVKGTWLVARMVLTWLGAGVTAFVVSDYVVRANMSSVKTTNEALISAMELLTQNIGKNTDALDGLREKLNELARSNVKQEGQLVGIQGQVDKIQSAVQEAGIDIKAAFTIDDLLKPDALDWTKIKTRYNISEGSPVFIQLEPDQRN